MQVPFDDAMGAIRFSVGKMTTALEIDRAIDIVVRAVQRLRQATVESKF